jgi:hypothetical protein
MQELKTKIALKIPGAITPAGLELPPNLTFEEWQTTGKKLFRLRQWCHFAIGDWLLYGEQYYDEQFAQAIDESEYSYFTLMHDKRVASCFEYCRRRQYLSWSHHAAVVSLPADLQDKLLDRAEKNNWSREELREAVQKLKGTQLSHRERGSLTAPSEQKTASAETTQDEEESPVSRINFGILIECADAEEQTALLARFSDEGLNCRPYIF